MTVRISQWKRVSFEGSSRPSRQVPWDQLARKSDPGGRPTPGEAGLPQAWPREVRAAPVATATRGLRRVSSPIRALLLRGDPFGVRSHLMAKSCSRACGSSLPSTEVTTANWGP